MKVGAECRPGCGQCCDPVHVNPLYRLRFILDHPHLEGVDPDFDWLVALQPADPADPASGRWRCPDFDSESRLCGRHETRPPVCRDFPYYGRASLPGRGLTAFPGCTFWSEVNVGWPALA